MSEVISFRLDSRNTREAQALKVLACHQERGYSVRHILTEALLRFEEAETQHEGQRQMAEILTEISRINDQLELLARSGAQPIGQPETQPSTLSNAFVLSVKSAVKPGLVFQG